MLKFIQSWGIISVGHSGGGGMPCFTGVIARYIYGKPKWEFVEFSFRDILFPTKLVIVIDQPFPSRSHNACIDCLGGQCDREHQS